MSKKHIGLLGGSFNPAHEGHVHISTEALKRLRLDEIWWLVTPQNPLKSSLHTAPYAERLREADAMVQQFPFIHVSDFEQQRGLRYTHATIKALKRCYPTLKFVWIMGADNLAHFHTWQHWRDILRLVPIAVFDRSPFSHTALHSKAALAFKAWRLPESTIATLASHPKRWAYILMRRHPASSTQLREERLIARLRSAN